MDICSKDFGNAPWTIWMPQWANHPYFTSEVHPLQVWKPLSCLSRNTMNSSIAKGQFYRSWRARMQMEQWLMTLREDDTRYARAQGVDRTKTTWLSENELPNNFWVLSNHKSTQSFQSENWADFLELNRGSEPMMIQRFKKPQRWWMLGAGPFPQPLRTDHPPPFPLFVYTTV